jgi:hypothetical protein
MLLRMFEKRLRGDRAIGETPLGYAEPTTTSSSTTPPFSGPSKARKPCTVPDQPALFRHGRLARQANDRGRLHPPAEEGKPV